MNEQRKPGVLLVTGGSRGIGAATVRRAAKHGWDVAINYASAKDAAEALAKEVEALGRRAVAVKADVSELTQIAPLFDAVEAGLGKVTGLVNSAGRVGLANPLIDADPEEIRRTIDLNVTGLILVTQEAFKRMAISRGGLGGPIVNLSSAAANIGSPKEFVWYAASKGAVDSFTLGAAQEVAADGIRLNAVSPGLIETEIHASAGVPERLARIAPRLPMKRSGTAEEVAEAILWLLSDAASYVTGSNLRVAGGR